VIKEYIYYLGDNDDYKYDDIDDDDDYDHIEL